MSARITSLAEEDLQDLFDAVSKVLAYSQDPTFDRLSPALKRMGVIYDDLSNLLSRPDVLPAPEYCNDDPQCRCSRCDGPTEELSC